MGEKLKIIVFWGYPAGAKKRCYPSEIRGRSTRKTEEVFV